MRQFENRIRLGLSGSTPKPTDNPCSRQKNTYSRTQSKPSNTQTRSTSYPLNLPRGTTGTCGIDTIAYRGLTPQGVQCE